MIDAITLTNFKGFPYQEIRPKQITAFVGPNGSGKSSALAGLLLLKQTVQEFPRETALLNLKDPLINLTACDALPANGTEQPVHYAYRTDQISLGEAEPEQGSLTFKWTEEKGLQDFAIEFPYGQAAVIKWKTVPGRRGLRQSRYPQFKDPIQDPFLRKTCIEQEAQAANNFMNPVLRDKVSRLLAAVLGMELKAAPPPDNPRAVLLKLAGPAGTRELADSGQGVSQLLMLLHQAATAQPGATLIIEKPEIHLHPQAQASLAEALARAALTENQQLIIETHSEALTTRLLTLVAERVLTPETLAVYAFAKDEKTGLCSAEELEVSPDGGIAGGIPDFFRANLAEMNRYVEAQFAQMKKE